MSKEYTDFYTWLVKKDQESKGGAIVGKAQCSQGCPYFQFLIETQRYALEQFDSPLCGVKYGKLAYKDKQGKIRQRYHDDKVMQAIASIDNSIASFNYEETTSRKVLSVIPTPNDCTVLTPAIFSQGPPSLDVSYRGYGYGDVRHGFSTGNFVSTSKVKKIWTNTKGTFIQTMNTKYQIIEV